MMLLAGLLLLLAGCSSPAAAAKLTDLQPAERTRTALLAKVVAGGAIGSPYPERWTATASTAASNSTAISEPHQLTSGPLG